MSVIIIWWEIVIIHEYPITSKIKLELKTIYGNMEFNFFFIIVAINIAYIVITAYVKHCIQFKILGR